MNLLFFRKRCPVVRDLLLARSMECGHQELPAFADNHLIACRGCREFRDALPVIDRLGPAWETPEPPPGLAQRTIARLDAEWPEASRPGVTRQETRLIWTAGLTMAGAVAAVALILADRIYPLAGNAGLEHLVEIGLRIGALQILGGTVVSIVVLVVRAMRSPETDIRDRDDQHGAGRE